MRTNYILLMLIAAIGLMAVCSYAAGLQSPGFESVWKSTEDSIEIPGKEERSWMLTAFPQKTGKVAVICFHAVLKANEGEIKARNDNVAIDPAQRMVFKGKNYLSLVWNSAPVLQNLGNSSFGLARLLNYSPKDPISGSEYFLKNQIAVPYNNKETGWFMIDVSDLVSSNEAGTLSENKLTMGNTNDMNIPLKISDLEAGYMPAQTIANFPGRKQSSSGVVKMTTKAQLKGKGFSVCLTKNGGLLFDNGRELYTIDSNFSYPQMQKDDWNKLTVADTLSKSGEWIFTAKKTETSFRIIGTGKYYELVRQVSIKNDHVIIKDTFSNLTNEPLGIAFDNKVTPTNAPKEINVCGPYKKTYMPYVPTNQVGNTTIFFAGNTSGLGITTVDDYYRLQVTMLQEGKSGVFRNVNFGLPGKDSYTFEWALYPTKSSDYYEFINKVRRDYVPSYPIEGSISFLNYGLVLSWPKEKLAEYLKNSGAKGLILGGPYSGGPWLGEDTIYIYKVPNFNLEEYLATMKKVRNIVRSIDPTVKCLTPFEMPLSPDMPAGDSTPKFTDSVAIMDNGLPLGYAMPTDPEGWKKFVEEKPHQFIYYPTMTNSYHKWVKERLIRGLDEGEADGIYFDCFNYGGNYTYDRWDNRTVDMNMNTFTITRMKSDLCKMTEDARADLVKMIVGRKKGNIVVVNGMGITKKIAALPIFHFNETLEDYGYVENHLTTPIVLGYTPGYAGGAEFIGKEGTWWKSWKTDSDYFQDIKDKLKSGCLYYTYVAPPGSYYDASLTRPTILTHMFPITVQELHAGWIKGKERIITLNPGTYSWGNKRPAQAYFYDAEGKECQGEIKTIQGQGGRNSFVISFPTGGAAVIEKK